MPHLLLYDVYSVCILFPMCGKFGCLFLSYELPQAFLLVNIINVRIMRVLSIYQNNWLHFFQLQHSMRTDILHLFSLLLWWYANFCQTITLEVVSSDTDDWQCEVGIPWPMTSYLCWWAARQILTDYDVHIYYPALCVQLLLIIAIGLCYSILLFSRRMATRALTV